MRRSRPCSVLVAAFVLSLAFAFADRASSLVIDDFGESPFTLSAAGSIQGSLLHAGAAGGERDIQYLASGSSTVTLEIGGGEFGISQSGPASALFLLDYDGADGAIALAPTGLGGLDLTESGAQAAISIEVLSINVPITLELEVYTDAANYSLATLAIGAAGTALFPHASFAALGSNGGVDFTNVGALRFRFSHPSAPGFEVRFGTIQTAVPEPGSALLLGFGVGALGLRRRRVR